jgi:hypothetical protein
VTKKLTAEHLGKLAEATLVGPQNAAAKQALGYAEALFNYRHVCEALGVEPLKLDVLKERAATGPLSIVQVVDAEKAATIRRYQLEQDRKIDKPVCVKCGRAVEPQGLDATGTCATCQGADHDAEQ